MILFPFATQATEPAPGASIEEPRLLIDGIFTNRQHKQTRASHPDQHTQTPNTGQADRQTTELKAQPQTDQRSQVGQTAIKRHPPTPGCQLSSRVTCMVTLADAECQDLLTLSARMQECGAYRRCVHGSSWMDAAVRWVRPVETLEQHVR